MAVADAYWAANINWTALTALVGGIGTLASPFLLAWWQGKAKNVENSIKAAEASADRIERAQKQLVTDLIAERDYHKKRVDEIDVERIEVAVEADQAHQAGRAMQEWSYWYRDTLYDVVHLYRDLAKKFERLAAGQIDVARAQEILNDVRATWPALPPTVPMLRDAATKIPPHRQEMK